MPENGKRTTSAAAGKGSLSPEAGRLPRPEKAAGERHISAGPKALSAVARLLGLEEKDDGWKLEGLCGLGAGNVRLSLKSGKHRLVFFLLPKEAPEGQVRAAGLSLSADGESGPGARRFLDAAALKLGARSVADVLSMIEDDPQSFVQTVVAGQTGDVVQVPCVGQSIGLLDNGWRNFFADMDFEVLLGVPEVASNRAANIEYADLECYYARPDRSFRKWTFLDWPEECRDQTSDTEDSKFSITAELEERDMILGTGERADAVVEEVRRLAKEGHFLVFTHLCTPIIMGEDFQGLARRCEKEVGGTAIRWSQKDRDENDNFGDYFRTLLAKPGFFDGPADPLAVNLFHFPTRCREGELRPLLERIGLKINISVFPDVDFPSTNDLPKAVWQVFCDRSSYPTKVRELLSRSPRPVLTVRAPYGVEGTRECVRRIAAAAGKEQEFDAAWAGELEAFTPAWEEMRKEAAGYRLGFVVSEATLPRLLTLRYGFGAPLAPMVREMGFGIDLLYYDIHGEKPKLPEGLDGARVTTFRSPWELERGLRDGEFRAVYSDIFFDWRITRAGKARFSSRDFEMGLQGARRTIQHLLRVCRLPFYRRYASHLARARGRVHA